MMEKRRIILFLVFAFAIAWITGLVIYLTGGLTGSPVLLPGTGITLALALLALVYMMAPSLANVLTRLVTREGWQNAFLRPNFRRTWRFWLAAWLLPLVFTMLGGAVYYLVFPSHFDASLSRVRMSLPPGAENINPWVFVLVQAVQALLLATVANSLFTFGEEFGWRGYLVPKLAAAGPRKAMLLSGLIWGVWHWPVIAMGHNYGLGYTGAPWLGMLAMVWFTFVVGTLFGWASLRAKSVWPAVIGHAVINGVAALPILFSSGEYHVLLGPIPVGLLASLPFALFTAWVLLSPRAFREEAQPAAVTAS